MLRDLWYRRLGLPAASGRLRNVGLSDRLGVGRKGAVVAAFRWPVPDPLDLRQDLPGPPLGADHRRPTGSGFSTARRKSSSSSAGVTPAHAAAVSTFEASTARWNVYSSGGTLMLVVLRAAALVPDAAVEDGL